MKNFLVSTISFYQSYLSFDKGFLAIFAPGGACRYPISCSEYTKQAIINKGVWTGLKLGFKRVWSCK